MIDMEGTHDEDEPTRWTSIGWQAALITNRLRNSAQLTEQNPLENDENTDKKRDPCDGPKDKVPDNAEERLRFVNTRLRELDRFEDRARGKRRN
jgi:hypothetical protein